MHLMVTRIPAVFAGLIQPCMAKEAWFGPALVTLTCLVCARYSGPIEQVTV
jgi:hypothetical protein